MLLPEWDNPLMSNNKAKRQSYQAVLASVKKEMAEPRVAESAQAPMTNTMKPAQKPQVGIPALLLLLALATACPVKSQSQTGPVVPTSGQAAQRALDQASIRVKVKLVDAPVVVSDSNGELVLNLSKSNFRVYDNGVKQTIESFDIGNAPLSMVIVVETSSRVEALLPALRRTGILLTQSVLGADGEAALIGYNNEVDRLLNFTSDDDAIEKAVGNIQMGTSGTHLYDALSQAVALLRARSASRRRVIVVLAEDADSGSEEKLAQVIGDAQLADITIYSVGLSSTAAEVRGPHVQAAPLSATPPGIFALPPTPGTVRTPTTEALRGGNMDLGWLGVWVVKRASAPLRDQPIETAAAATGGLYQSTFRDSAIGSAIDKIGGELHAEYTLSYRPIGPEAGGYHEIRVDVDRGGLTIRSRPGYYLGPSVE
jgi:VWFA-related protein